MCCSLKSSKRTQHTCSASVRSECALTASTTNAGTNVVTAVVCAENILHTFMVQNYPSRFSAHRVAAYIVTRSNGRGGGGRPHGAPSGEGLFVMVSTGPRTEAATHAHAGVQAGCKQGKKR